MWSVLSINSFPVFFWLENFNPTTVTTKARFKLGFSASRVRQSLNLPVFRSIVEKRMPCGKFRVPQDAQASAYSCSDVYCCIKMTKNSKKGSISAPSVLQYTLNPDLMPGHVLSMVGTSLNLHMWLVNMKQYCPSCFPREGELLIGSYLGPRQSSSGVLVESCRDFGCDLCGRWIKVYIHPQYTLVMQCWYRTTTYVESLNMWICSECHIPGEQSG